MTDKGEQPVEGEQVDYKAELEKMKAENENLKKGNEELRLEFMGEDYLEFLNAKGKGSEKPAEKKAEQAPAGDEFAGLTPKQIHEKILADAKAAAKAEVESLKAQQAAETSEKIQADVKKFASKTPDFEDYRPIMYGLSTDPKFANATLDELYAAAKGQVKKLVTGATEAEKEKSRKSSNEKPGHSSSSFQKSSKKLSADEAAEEAWDEVVGKDKTYLSA